MMIVETYKELRSCMDEMVPTWRFWVGLFLLQGFIGVATFEWAYSRTLRVRKGPNELFEQFPTFRRFDTHMWSRSKFYPGCFVMLIPRFFIILSIFFGVLVLNWFLYIG